MSDQNIDPRLGTQGADGKFNFPKRNVLGDEYKIAESIQQGIGRNQEGQRCFVMLPIGKDCEAAIAEVKALMAPPANEEQTQEIKGNDRKGRSTKPDAGSGNADGAESPSGNV
jgi:hypothetical protein